MEISPALSHSSPGSPAVKDVPLWDPGTLVTLPPPPHVPAGCGCLFAFWRASRRCGYVGTGTGIQGGARGVACGLGIQPPG